MSEEGCQIRIKQHLCFCEKRNKKIAEEFEGLNKVKYKNQRQRDEVIDEQIRKLFEAGNSTAKVAEMVGKSVSTVRGRVFRMRKRGIEVVGSDNRH